MFSSLSLCQIPRLLSNPTWLYSFWTLIFFQPGEKKRNINQVQLYYPLLPSLSQLINLKSFNNFIDFRKTARICCCSAFLKKSCGNPNINECPSFLVSPFSLSVCHVFTILHILRNTHSFLALWKTSKQKNIKQNTKLVEFD